MSFEFVRSPFDTFFAVASNVPSVHEIGSPPAPLHVPSSFTDSVRIVHFAFVYAFSRTGFRTFLSNCARDSEESFFFASITFFSNSSFVISPRYRFFPRERFIRSASTNAFSTVSDETVFMYKMLARRNPLSRVSFSYAIPSIFTFTNGCLWPRRLR